MSKKGASGRWNVKTHEEEEGFLRKRKEPSLSLPMKRWLRETSRKKEGKIYIRLPPKEKTIPIPKGRMGTWKKGPLILRGEGEKRKVYPIMQVFKAEPEIEEKGGGCFAFLKKKKRKQPSMIEDLGFRYTRKRGPILPLLQKKKKNRERRFHYARGGSITDPGKRKETTPNFFEERGREGGKSSSACAKLSGS